MGRAKYARRTADGFAIVANPFTPDEDEKLAEVNRIGLAIDFWHVAFPDRPIRHLLDRRLQLGIKPAPLI